MKRLLLLASLISLTTAIGAQESGSEIGNDSLSQVLSDSTTNIELPIERDVVTAEDTTDIESTESVGTTEPDSNVEAESQLVEDDTPPQQVIQNEETSQIENRTIGGENVDSLKSIINSLKEEVTQLKSDKVVSPTTSVVNEPTESDEVAINSLYQKAIKLQRGKQYRESISMMTDLLINYPNSVLAGNFQYWIGESLFLLGDYNGAIDAFKKVFNYTNTYKLDDAQYMLGKANLFMGNKSQAGIEFETLLVKYPESEYVKQANKLMKKAR